MTEREPTAAEARRRAEEQLAAVRGRGPHIRWLAEEWRRRFRENHFAPLIEEAFKA